MWISTQERSMAKLFVMYKTPEDAAGFDRRYFESHVPLAKKLPGLRKYEVSRGPVMTPFGPSGIHLVATLHFDDMAALQAAMGSAEGRAAGADAQELSAMDLLIFDDREV
jgi:uncharacterized protein (TIGR02118 family)